MTTRAQSIELATELYARLEAHPSVKSRLRIDLRPGTADYLAALRYPVAQKIADALEQYGDVKSDRQRLKEWTRARLYDAKERAMGKLLAATGRGSWPRISGATETRILLVARSRSHFRDLLLVARSARSSPRSFWWITFRPDHADVIAAAGEHVVLASSYAPSRWLAGVGLRAESLLSLRAADSEPPRDVDREAWHRMVTTVHAQAQAQLPYATIAAGAVVRAIDELHPSAVFAGNPNVMECALATAVARARGLPVISMQHGVMTPNHREWANADVDRMLVWGAEAKRALEAVGFPTSRVKIVGAPWVDELRKKRELAAKRSAGRVLVAMSGAGHSVGLDEHVSHIERLMQAAAGTPIHRWMFRLHPKDDPELYRGRRSSANVEIIPAREAKGDIHDALEESDLLITITSASALDAMLHRVPVLTLARPPGEREAEFVRAGATIDVPAEEQLEPVIETLIREGAPPDIAARADLYVASFFGPLDGRAAERVLSELSAAAAERSPPDLRR